MWIVDYVSEFALCKIPLPKKKHFKSLHHTIRMKMRDFSARLEVSLWLWLKQLLRKKVLSLEPFLTRTGKCVILGLIV